MKDYTIRITRTDEWSVNIKAKDDEEVEEKLEEIQSTVETLDTTVIPETAIFLNGRYLPLGWNDGDWDIDYELWDN